jgi:hypothetical protein
MGFTTAELPPVEPTDFESLPFMERMRMLATHWCEYGFGTPKQINVLYIIKIVLYAVFGVLIVALTTDGVALNNMGDWWDEAIVYQKLMVWTVLVEIIGLASSSGPLAFHFSPFIGGILYWAKPGTLRVPPWAGKVPFTSGDHRTLFDVGLYLVLVANLILLLFMSGTEVDDLPTGSLGVLPQWAILSFVGLLIVMGLRDKVVFLAARSEQYLPTMFFFGAFASFVDMIVAAKIAIVIIWVGAGVSKIGRHFTPTVSVMISNTPWITSRRFKRSLSRDFPDDIRPSHVAGGFAHIGGTLVELVLPFVLLFSTNTTVTLLAIIGMLIFHVFIISTFPLAVPLEWNVFFMYAVVFLFAGFPAGDGYAVGDMSGWLLALVLVITLTPPIVGNLRPDLVSFLPSMRQYAGNWASGMWAFRDREAEEKLNTYIVKSADNQIDQVVPLFGEEISEIFLQKAVAFRTMHTQGRALLSLIMRHVPTLEGRVVREAEFVCNTLLGWNFGDGHLHDERLIAAVQKRCNFEPGELVIAWTESQPIHKNYVEYRVIDAALGVVERGTYVVADAADEQPWLPNGPIPHEVTWTAPGYEAPGVPMNAAE